MQRIVDVRAALAGIAGALIPFQPERAEQGDLEGVRQLWDVQPEDDGDSQGISPDEEQDGEPGSLEELIEFAPPSEDDLINALGGPEKAVGNLPSCNWARTDRAPGVRAHRLPL